MLNIIGELIRGVFEPEKCMSVHMNRLLCRAKGMQAGRRQGVDAGRMYGCQWVRVSLPKVWIKLEHLSHQIRQQLERLVSERGTVVRWFGYWKLVGREGEKGTHQFLLKHIGHVHARLGFIFTLSVVIFIVHTLHAKKKSNPCVVWLHLDYSVDPFPCTHTHTCTHTRRGAIVGDSHGACSQSHS